MEFMTFHTTFSLPNEIFIKCRKLLSQMWSLRFIWNLISNSAIMWKAVRDIGQIE